MTDFLYSVVLWNHARPEIVSKHTFSIKTQNKLRLSVRYFMLLYFLMMCYMTRLSLNTMYSKCIPSFDKTDTVI